MKALHMITFLLLAGGLRGYSQSYAAYYGLNKVHLTDSDKTVIAEINPEQDHPKPKSNLYYTWYLTNAIHVTEGGYGGKLLNGIYKEYFLNNNLKVYGTYRNGLKDGTFKEWTIKGMLASYTTWKEGVLDGTYQRFDGNGHSEKGYYKNGVIKTEGHRSIWQKINLFKKD